MKIEITDISDVYPGEFSLIREIDNDFIVEKLEADVDYYKSDHKHLVEKMVFGERQSDGTMSIECGDNILSKNINIKHSEGTFDLIGCKTTKKVFFENALDCIATKSINIFDYDRSETKTIQGNGVDRITININKNYYFNNANYSLQDVLNFLNLESRENEGYYIESGRIRTIVEILEGQGGQGSQDEYQDHKIEVSITYVRLTSSSQPSTEWILIPGGTDYYYSGVSNAEFSLINTESIYIDSVNPYFENTYKAGRGNLYQQIDISNTILINTILEDIFVCTGKTLISNFFNINSDSTAPNNKYYEWAASFAQHIKIAQSYDIIKEDAENDSFGNSGIIKVKTLLLNLFKAFGIRLDVDGNNIRIEHFTYFTNKGINIKTKDYEFKPLQANKDSIDSETFTFAKQVSSSNFYKAKIEYITNDLYSEENDIKHPCDIMLTDVFGALNNEALTEDGTFEDFFFLLCTDGTSIIELNNPFSMLNLVKELHDTNRPMKTGILNGENITFGANSLGLTGEILLNSNAMTWNLIKPLMSVETNEGFYLVDSVELDQTNTLTIKTKK